jgi:hypothetical protein
MNCGDGVHARDLGCAERCRRRRAAGLRGDAATSNA